MIISPETQTFNPATVETYRAGDTIERFTRHSYVETTAIPALMDTNGESADWAAQLEGYLEKSILAGESVVGKEKRGTADFVILDKIGTQGAFYQVPFSGKVTAYGFSRLEGRNWVVTDRIVGRKRNVVPFIPPEGIVYMHRSFSNGPRYAGKPPVVTAEGGPVKDFFDGIAAIASDHDKQTQSRIPAQRRHVIGGRLFKAIGV